MFSCHGGAALSAKLGALVLGETALVTRHCEGVRGSAEPETPQLGAEGACADDGIAEVGRKLEPKVAAMAVSL